MRETFRVHTFVTMAVFVGRVVSTGKKNATDRMKPRGNGGDERGRIEFLLRRDGLTSTLEWVDRTMKIYRRAVLSKNHYGGLPEYRRKFIRSYCEFKHWLTKPLRDDSNHDENL